jgi:polysaccharide biosynthesis transport protein
MSANVSPVLAGSNTAIEQAPSYAPQHYRGGADGGPPAPDQGAQLSRFLNALGRYKWLVMGAVLIGSVGGVAATRYIDPQYEVASTILITSSMRAGAASQSGPIREEQQFDPQGWIDLLRSFAIADSVVMKLSLYVKPKDAADSSIFRDFTINRTAQRWVPGNYTLKVEGARYTLRDGIGLVNETGIVGDSVGRLAGFMWRPARARLGSSRTVKFTVQTPRETSVELLQRLSIKLAPGSNLIVLGLTGKAQDKPSETLNAWGEQFVRIATDLKSARVAQFTKILNAQRADAADRLVKAERDLQQFRVQTIALPSEGTGVTPGTNGLELNTDPVLKNYFDQKFALEGIRRDRLNLERVANEVTATSTPVEALLAVHTVANDPIAGPLRGLLQEYSNREVNLRVLRTTYTDSNIIVKPRIAELRELQAQIPAQVRDVLSQVRQRESTLEQVIANGTRELQSIPARTINQEALRREVEGASQLYTALQTRFSEAELSEKSTIPDVRILDTAVMPLAPSSNTVPGIIAIAVLGSLGVGIGLTLLLDRFDRRFRYPTQVTNELGLQILGVVPHVDQTRRESPEKVAQIVEAFRSIRMNVRYACMPAPRVALTITSPGPGDGKSLVASNLALSFAEGGWRTVLVDGDLRRGQLHVTFDLPQGPGLVEYLEGSGLLGEVLYQTNHENLMLMPSGARHRRGPELLATPRMQQLVAALGADYDAIIIDTPPLGAGTDAYAIGTVTGNIALVLRSAATDLRMAQAKLRTLDQLPVQVVGAILNGITTEGVYQFYAYDPEYAMLEESAPAGQLAAANDH